MESQDVASLPCAPDSCGQKALGGSRPGHCKMGRPVAQGVAVPRPNVQKGPDLWWQAARTVLAIWRDALRNASSRSTHSSASLACLPRTTTANATCVHQSCAARSHTGARTNADCAGRKGWTERLDGKDTLGPDDLQVELMVRCQPVARSGSVKGSVTGFLSRKPQDLSRYSELKRQAIEARAQLGLAPATP